MNENKIVLIWLVLDWYHSASARVNQCLQSHHIYLMLLKGELQRAPIDKPGRVLDLGTGTGIWAIDFAE